MLWYLETVLLRQAYLPSNMLWYLETALQRQAYFPSNMLWYCTCIHESDAELICMRFSQTFQGIVLCFRLLYAIVLSSLVYDACVCACVCVCVCAPARARVCVCVCVCVWLLLLLLLLLLFIGIVQRS